MVFPVCVIIQVVKTCYPLHNEPNGFSVVYLKETFHLRKVNVWDPHPLARAKLRARTLRVGCPRAYASSVIIYDPRIHRFAMSPRSSEREPLRGSLSSLQVPQDYKLHSRPKIAASGVPERRPKPRRLPRQVQDRVRAPGQEHRAEGRRHHATVRRLRQQEHHASAISQEQRAVRGRDRDRQGKERTAVLTRDKKEVRRYSPEAWNRSVFSCLKDISCTMAAPAPCHKLSMDEIYN